MITINKNTTNIVIIRDGVKPIYDYYLMVVYNKNGDVNKYFQISDSSPYPEYLKFMVDEDIVEDKIAGKVYFPGNTTDYDYEIYYLTGMVNDEPGLDNVFNIKVPSELVSKGILRVMGEEQSTIDNIYL